MAIDEGRWIGKRVASWRDVGGITQLQLATKVGVTRGYISLIENGHKAITKRSLLIALAGALGVSVMDLIATPYEANSREDLLALSIAASVRAALDGDTTAPHSTPDDLRAGARRVIAARMACDNATMADLLPRVIGEARAAANEGAYEEIQKAGLDAVVKSCIYGSYVLKTAGNFDLSMRMAERAQLAAEKLGSPIHTAASHMALAQSLMACGLRERALKISIAGMDLAQTHLSDPAGLVWYGTLSMQAGLTSASLGRADDANAHMSEAADAAERADGDHEWGNEFTPANVKLWKVGVALENGEPGRAPVLARTIDTAQLRSPQRVARLHIDSGRGMYHAGQHEDAIAEFQKAFVAAPSEVRHRASVREIVGELVRSARRNAGSPALRDLAAKMGVDPVAEA